MPAAPRHHPALTLFLDFDGTLTHSDTLAALASIPYTLRASRPPTTSPAPPPLPPFTHFSHLYLSSLAFHTTTYHPPTPQRTTPALELAFLASQRALEEASVRRVEAAGVFRGVRRADIESGARRMVRSGEVRVREGWVGALRAGEAVWVVSVNWSRAWVRGVLDAGIGGEGVRVVANEVGGLDAEGGSAGGLEGWWGGEGGVWSGGDKVRVVEEVLEGGEGGAWSVFVGDSVGDLAPLLWCDVGVCVRDEVMGEGQRALAEGLERVGVRCGWVGEWDGGRGGGERVWWARAWEEVVASGVLEGAKGR